MQNRGKLEVERAQEAVEALDNVFDLTDTADIEVKLDAVASALLKLNPRRRAKKSRKEEELADVLSRFVEDELADPTTITLCDEIRKVIEFKDYEGYSDEYISERLGALLSDLANELKPTIDKLRIETGK
jgi:hypothetical protein